MRYGAVFPTTEIGSDPIAVRDFAQAAEELGYARLTAYDHVLGAEHADRSLPLTGPYNQNDPFHEPMVLFGYLAGLTTTIELVTGVMILPQRQAVLVAKQAAGPAIVEALITLRELLIEAGRDTTSFGSEMLIDYALGSETWHEHASAWEQAGGSIISMRAMSTGSQYMKVPVPNFSSPDQHLDALEIFMREMAG